MDFLEKTLEDIIYENSLTFEGRAELTMRGLDIYGQIYRQVNLGGYGIADLITIQIEELGSEYSYNRNITITIYELKKDEISFSALLQVCRYKTAIRRIIDSCDFKKTKFEVKAVLIGKKIDKSDFCLLYNECFHLDLCDIYTYNYSIDGITFNLLLGNFIKDIENLPTIPKFTLKELKNMYCYE